MNTIVGRITKNAEINALKNDKQVVNFSVAINDNYKTKDGERREQTTYYNCSYWISPNVAKILTKGSLVELSGRISSTAWIGKDGEIKSGLNFHTSKIKLHGGGKKSETGVANFNQKGQSNSQFTTNPQNTNVPDDETDDDLPF
ncbi:single-stranded DNA-binding protein [Chryseobacterium manosquense]|uniref:Single-stranded DNA-binding protein n=1 Tax=Chryseobacterium manosquense TaxID=2754694 RepID=A0A7H1DXG8_9FLAO|nr:single-stranded DNA-binding protein [Chryseobacterium manosquense]QNS41676.1 single-stranded DNA-binding protein [Chryseobacterium manosquense]